MSQILKDLNKLAAKMGAPVVGRNISEQVRAISTYYDGTSHGANIADRINEVARSNIGSGSAVLISKTINQNGIYLATDDEANGYSDVNVNVQPTLVAKNVAANGTYNASDDNANGYSSVTVAVNDKYISGAELIYTADPTFPIMSFDQNYEVTLPFTYEVCCKVSSSHTTNGRWSQLSKYSISGAVISACIACNGTNDKNIEIALNAQWYSSINIPQVADALTTISIVVRETEFDLYINGVFQSTIDVTNPGQWSSYIGSMKRIYMRSGSTDQRTIQNGSLYAVRMYNKALTQNEIMKNRNADVSLFS